MKRFISIILVVLMLANTFAVFAQNTDDKGQTFTASDMYKTMSAPKSTPRSFEAWIKVDKNAPSSRLGIMVGNFGGAAEFSAINFEIRNNGNPYIYWNAKTVEFTNVDLRTGEKLHLAIVTTATEAYCYINGELKQTVKATLADIPSNKMNNFVIGGDFRSGNAQYLKNTQLYSTALYSDSRSADQVKSDMNKVNLEDKALLMSYDMTVSGKERLRDYSANENHLIYTNSADKSKNESYVEIEEIKDGFEFPVSDTYRMEKTLDKLPVSFEATVCFPKTMSSSERGGVIIGTYGGATRCINFEVYSNGAPRLYWVDSKGNIANFVFANVNLYNGEWTHVAIVCDNMKIHCYINGELAQTLKTSKLSQEACPDKFVVGGDLRSGNAQYFKGRIKSFAIYSDVRTADEVKADFKASTVDKESLIAAYDFSKIEAGKTPDKISDLGTNGNDLKLYTTWIDNIPETKDYAYSFAVVGDTQIVTEYHPDKLACIYDWIVNNAQEKKIKFVLGLGDITNSNTSAEWNVAKKNIAKLDGVLPYSLCRGNHDSSGNFNNAFLSSPYRDLVGGRFGKSIENTWQELIVGETKYLIFTLDYGASDAVLNWAGEIISSHPEHNVIITTHAYLFRDGTTLDQGDVCPPATTGGSNNGDHIWTKLISQHKNITLVLSGHDPCDKVIMTQTKGVHGNIVTQMLIDPQGVDAAQGATGLVAMLYFSEDGKNVSVEYYSTVMEKYFMTENQFEMTIETVAKKSETNEEPNTDPKPGEDKEPQKGEDKENEKENEKEKEDSKAPIYAAVVVIFIGVALITIVLVTRKRRK